MAEVHSEPLIGNLAKFAMGSVGSKVVMAVTGLGLWVFITGHLAGNLLAYAGPEAFNHYAETLKGTPVLLWGTRAALLIGMPLHFITAYRTWALNRAARPVPYAYDNKSPARMAAKTMILSGSVILAFFAFHLAHFTLHLVGPMPTTVSATGGWDAYSMLVLGFQNPVIAVFYIVAQVLLAAHLSHGIYSMVQHLGLWGKAWTPFVKTASQVIGYGLCFAFASIPLSVLLGIIKP
jgi:succinate dehydrogenase / fumarate reductase, cytochrome b subunit